MTRTTQLAAVLVLATACAPAEHPVHTRSLALPATFAGAAAGPSAATIDWAKFFDDEQLNALIGQALAGSFDVEIALQHVELARANVQQASAVRLPEIGLAASAGLTRYSRYTAEGAGNAATDIRSGQRVPTNLPDLFVGVQASWEVDLWGRLGNLHGAARERYLASIEGTNLVITNLVADVATAYYELVALDRTREVVDETLAHQAQALDMMRLEKQAGNTTELAVEQFAAQLAGTRALRAATLDRTQQVESRIDLLLGRMPQPIARSASVLERAVAPTMATGVPSDLLRNRPDIRAAELEVAAARLDVAAARKAFYPHLTISASLGYQAFDPRFLLSTPASLAYSIAGGLVAPLINRRGIAAAFAAARATQVETLYAYQRTVLQAFLEVTTGLATIQHASEIVTQRTEKLTALAGTVDAADALFRAGKATYLDVLIAQQNRLQAELELIDARRDQHIAAVQLYRALGGGWRGAVAPKSADLAHRVEHVLRRGPG